MTSADIWPIVKLRLGLSDDALKPLIESYIEEIGARILHYCNVQSVPSGLKFVWVSMVIDAVRVDLPNVDEIGQTVADGGNVKIGDTSVSAGQGSGITNVSKSAIETVVFNYRVDLNRYRKLRW